MYTPSFFAQFIKDTLTKKASSSVSSTNMISTHLKIQNSNFGATDSRNLIHPVLVTNSYGASVSVTPDQYSSSALSLQCKDNDTNSIGAFKIGYADDVYKAPRPFHVLSDGQIECTKALLVNSKTGENSSSI